MKTEVKKIDPSKREINVEVTGDVVTKKFEDVFVAIAKEAKVPGFRPGHAPRDLLEKHYSTAAYEQVLKELVPEIYSQAVDKEGLDVIELPQITEVKLERSSLSFKATVEVAPEIALKDYKGIKINYKKIEVSPDEVKRNLDSIKESRKIENLDDNFARSLSYPNLQELEKAVERQIFIHKENSERERIENEIVESLMKGLDFKVPQSMIARQLQDLVRQAKLDLALKGVGREQIEAEEKKLTENLGPEAERQVRVYLVLAEVAKREKISVDNQMPRKAMEFLLKEADWKEAS